ncbi:glycosyltransferase family 4 protein [Rahnella aceris]|jgi:glycosyltransferase involved in cell wall biosynthesis|uniref:glycosyltransferase family 4 protein n=1 Tax=Rahnella sp. (strain Y9602) TaxID=2703885 RepID=UPI003FD4459E
MRKILVLTNEFYPFKGGIGRYCEELINVIKNDNLVTLIAPEYNATLKDSELSHGITLDLFSGGQFKYWHLPRLIKKVISVDFRKYDYVLVADWPFWVAIQCINMLRIQNKIQFNLMLHGSEVLNLKNGKASIFAKSLNLFSGIKTIFTNSNYTKRILLENHAVPSNIPVVVTYLGVSQDSNLSNENYIDNINSKQFNVLTVGRLDERKGYDYVIESLGLIPPDIRKEIHYTVVGNGSDEYKNKLKDLARKNQVNLDIRTGVDDKELENIYKNNKVFILAAKHSNKKIEGFGLVFLEAAKYGVPSIATDVGAISEVVINNHTGLVVKESINEISAAILKLYNERQTLARLSNNCIVEVKKFTWSKLADLTLNDFSGEDYHEKRKGIVR